MSYADIEGTRRFLINSRDELQYYKALFSTIIGMRDPFYVPTWRNDLTLHAAPVPGTAVIIVHNDPAFPTEWWASGSRIDLQLETSDGTIQRRISGVVNNLDGTTTITFTANMPAGTWTTSVVSFLEYARLGSDTITFSHYGQFSVVDFAIRILGQETP